MRTSSPSRPDSVPPLSATLDEAPHTSSRVWPWVMRAVVLATTGAIVAGAYWLENRPRHTAHAGLATRIPLAPPPIAPTTSDEDIEPATLEEQRERLYSVMRAELDLSDPQMAAVRSIFSASPILGQGNPAITMHPMSRSECKRRRLEAGSTQADVPSCGAKGMVPLYDASSGQTPNDAKVCMDQLEFPNVPCEYPVVHVRAREAAELCRAVGKRICDTHEWEGACAGSVRSADVEYEWGRPRAEASWYHNFKREKVWSYGPAKNHSICGTNSFRTPNCPGGGYEKCGSNTYPAGSFPDCHSPLGVFDMHGNAAEHMNLPILPSELARYGRYGFTEMKGSWFVFSSIEAHEDDCRWRAPSWHETRLASETSHANYHLGFRCCKDLE